ncbi:autotransporter domain-containing protein [Achromobacter aloeverae]
MAKNDPRFPQAAAASPGRRFRFIPKLGALALAQIFSPLAMAEGDDWNLARVRANETFHLGKTGAGVLVGVVDDGIFADDPAFAGRIDPRSAGFDDTDNARFQAQAATDSHGSMVAGIIAGSGRNGDVRGVAPDARLLVARYDDGSGDGEDSSSRATRHAVDAGARIINQSFGPPPYPRLRDDDGELNSEHAVLGQHIIEFDSRRNTLQKYDAEAVSYAASKDVLVVVAAGNEFGEQPVASLNPSGNGMLPLITPENTRRGLYRFVDASAPDHDADDPETYTYIDPEDARVSGLDYSPLKSSVIAVVATDRDNNVTRYSNRCGDAWQWCIAAPGGDQDAEDEGGGAAGNSYRVIGDGGERARRVAGTSGAAPHVAGAAAIVRGAFPFLTAAQTQETLLTTANDTGRLSGRRTYGRGLLDVERASRGPGAFGAEGFGRFFDVDTQGHDGVFSNDIKGPGGLVKRGAGTLELSGANTFSGDTIVAGGTLKVTGSTAASKLNVRPGATLTGSGTVGATAADGIVVPGGAGGRVLTVAGDFTLGPQGVIRSTLAGDGTLDRLAVAGSASLNGGTLQVNGVNSSLLGRQFTLIDTGQGVSGNFDRVQGDAAPLFSSISTSVQDRRLTVSVGRNPGGFGAVAANANQRAAGKAADTLRAGNPVFERLFNATDADTARRTLAPLAGDIHPSVNGILAAQQAQTRAILLDRAAPPRAGATDANGGAGVWGEYLNQRGNLAGDGNAAGLRRGGSGLIFGADTAVSPATRLGGALSFGNASVNTRGAGAGQRAGIGGASVSAYGSTEAGAANLRYGATLGMHDVKTRRDTGFGRANAKYRTGAAQVFGVAGLPYAIGDAVVEPYAGLAYDHARSGSFRESGAGAANLQGSRAAQGNLSSTLGVRAHTAWDLGKDGKLGVHGQAGWQHAYGNVTPATRMRLGDSAAFTTLGLPRSRDTLLVNAGATWHYTRDGSASLGYGGAFGDRGTDHSVRLNLGWRF